MESLNHLVPTGSFRLSRTAVKADQSPYAHRRLDSEKVHSLLRGLAYLMSHHLMKT